MKKFALAAVAAASMFCAGAQAYTTGIFSNGFVVPNVIHNGPSDTTAVGIISKGNAGNPRSIYWTFFDQNSNHVTDGCFVVTHNDYEPFVWSERSGTGLEGKRGYLVFSVGSPPAPGATTCPLTSAPGLGAGQPGNPGIAGSAFQVNLTNKDVAFVPVIDGNLTYAAGSELTTLGPNSITAVAGAAQVIAAGPVIAGNPVMNMRYFIDGAAGGTETRIVVWSTGDHRGTHTVNMFDDKQGRKSVNFELNHAELDWFDPETIPGRPAGFVDGFIEWNPGAVVPADFATKGGVAPALATGPGSVFTYSVIDAPAFGAVQTVLGAHHLAP